MSGDMKYSPVKFSFWRPPLVILIDGRGFYAEKRLLAIGTAGQSLSPSSKSRLLPSHINENCVVSAQQKTLLTRRLTLIF